MVDLRKRVDKIVAEWLDQRARGGTISQDDVVDAHADLADALRDRFRELASEESASTVASTQPPSSASALLEKLTKGERPGYTHKTEIARGGMGAILRIRDESLRRDLAMKVVLEERGGGDAESSSAYVHRFVEEAQVTAQLDHPGVVPVHELGVDADGRVFFTMKLVKGRTLGEIFKLVRDGAEDWNLSRALQIFVRVCETLAFAHSKGVVHRDLKPANIMIGDFGEVYVMDWGLAKVLGEHVETEEQDIQRSLVRSERAVDGSSHNSPYLTQAGDVLGTPTYMPLEQAMGRRLDARSDVYATGAMLYELLAGHTPYGEPEKKRNAYDILTALMAEPPTDISERAPDVSAELVAITGKAMARDPANRYQTAAELGHEIRQFIEGRVVRAYRTGPIVELRMWMQRNKALASAIAATILVAIAGLSATLVVQEKARGELVTARDQARSDADRAERSNREAQHQAYLANMTAAGVFLTSGNVAAARRNLAACPEPLRGWEWRFQSARCDTSLGVVASVRSGIGREPGINFSGDGRRFALTGESVAVFDTATRQRVDKPVPKSDPKHGRSRCSNAILNKDGSRAFVIVHHRQSGLAGPFRLTTSNVADGSVIDERTLEFKAAARGFEQPGERGNWWFDTLLASNDRSVIAAVVQYGTRETREFHEVFHVWNSATGKLLASVGASRDSEIALAPDGRKAAILGQDGRLQLINTTTGKSTTARVWEQESDLQKLVFTADGTRLVTVSQHFDKSGSHVSVIVIDAAIAGVLRILTPEVGGRYGWHDWILIPGTNRFVVTDDKNLLALSLDLTSDRSRGGRPDVAVWRGHERSISNIVVSPDGRAIVSCDRGGRVRVWNASGSDPILPLHQGLYLEWAQSEDGKRIVCLVQPRGEPWLEFLSPETGEVTKTLAVARVSGSHLNSFAASADLAQVAISDTNGAVRVIDAKSGEVLHNLQVVLAPQDGLYEPPEGEKWRIYRTYVSFSPNGRLLALSVTLMSENQNMVGDGPVRVWSLETGQQVASMPKAGCSSPALFTPDGTRLVTSREVWEVGSWQSLGKLGLNSSSATALSPDGRLFARESGESDWYSSKIELWDLVTLEQVGTMSVHDDAIVSLAFSPDGARLVSGDWRGSIRIWDATSMELVSTWDRKDQNTPRSSYARLASVGFSPDGERLYHVSGTRLIVWDCDVTSARRIWRYRSAR